MVIKVSDSLSVEISGIELENPLIVASSDITNNLVGIKKAEKCRAGAVIIKTASIYGRGLYPTVQPRVTLDRSSGTIFLQAGTRFESFDKALQLIERAKKETDLVIIASSGLSLDDVDRGVKGLRMIEEAGADALELNLQRPGRIGTTPEIGKAVNKIVKESIGIPVISKMNVAGIDVCDVAEACVNGGADAISAMNIIQGAPEIDIFNDGRPMHPGLNTCKFVGIGGSAIRNVAYSSIAKLALKLGVPIIGGGGLLSWRHAITMMMYGATAVSFATAIMINGFEFIEKTERKMEEFIQEQGYSSVSDFRGTALKHTLLADKIEYVPVVATIDEGKCTLCGSCIKQGQCDLFKIVEGKVLVDSNKCTGCGWCYYICPMGAISLEEVSL